MNLVIIILFFVTLFGLLVPLPLVLIKSKAKLNAAEITFKESWNLYVRKTAKKPIFQALAISQQHHLGISLEQIEVHWLSSGNPAIVMEALAKYAHNPEITFQKLTALDLAKRDLEQAIELEQTIYKIDISELVVKSFKVEYEASFKLGLFAVFNDNTPEMVEQKVIEKLKLFAATWTSSDAINTQNFILTNILNTEYWENVLKAKLINQSIKIKI